MNIFDLLEIDPLKDSAPAFASQFTDSGYVGGGGAGFGGGFYPMGGTGGGGAACTTAARTSLASLIVMARTCAAAAGHVQHGCCLCGWLRNGHHHATHDVQLLGFAKGRY